MRTDVIVVGAGPVGLLLAGELRLGGAQVTVLDRLAAPAGESRALGFNRRAAESLGQRGLLPRLGTFRWGAMGHFGGVRIDLGMLAEDQSGVLGLSQARTEEMLAGWLAELGVPVLRGHELTGLRETADGVELAVEGPDGPVPASARFAVGCDGAGSTVRTLAGIPVERRESRRSMYTAEISGVALRPRPIGERLPGGDMVVCTPLGDGRFRIVVHDRGLPPTPVSDRPDFREVAGAWQRLTGESLDGAQVSWTWACGNASGLAREYRRGRVLLAGDAAHELPPLAAWGLSAGLQDAANLGWKLAATLAGKAPEDLLDTYHAERHPVGRNLIRDAQAASALYLGDTGTDPLREVVAELVRHQDAAAHLAGIVSGLGIRYDMGPGDHPLLGRRMPLDAGVALSDGTHARIGDLLHAARGILVTTPGHDAPEPPGGWPDRIRIVCGSWDPTPSGAPLDAALIRPDGYVAWTSPGTATELGAALRRWFGTSRSTLAA